MRRQELIDCAPGILTLPGDKLLFDYGATTRAFFEGQYDRREITYL